MSPRATSFKLLVAIRFKDYVKIFIEIVLDLFMSVLILPVVYGPVQTPGLSDDKWTSLSVLLNTHPHAHAPRVSS